MLDHFSKSPLKWILGAFGVAVLALLIFDAGIALGERRARPHPEAPFSAYGMPLPHTFGEEDHGAVGTVASSSLPGSFTLSTRDGDTDTILIGASTELEPQGTPTSTLLLPGSRVIVIGEPEQNDSIQATLIRVLPQ